MAQQMGWGLVEEGWRKGPWTAEEDRLLVEYVKLHGEGRWNNVARAAGLKRNGKSCRLRWVNYLRPDLKRGQITPHEERIIIELHARWGNRWSTIARSLPGRTDNEIKNYWRTHFKKKAKSSSKSREKSRAHQLRRHQFQQHQQDQLDMEKIMSLFDESDPRMQTFTLLRQDMVYPSAPEQGFFHSMTNGYASVPDQTSNQDMIISDGFWNLDDLHGNITNWANHQRSFASDFY